MLLTVSETVTAPYTFGNTKHNAVNMAVFVPRNSLYNFVAFGDQPRRMLKIIRRLDRHCGCLLQGGSVMVEHFQQSHVDRQWVDIGYCGAGWRRGTTGRYVNVFLVLDPSNCSILLLRSKVWSAKSSIPPGCFKMLRHAYSATAVGPSPFRLVTQFAFCLHLPP